MDGREAYVVWIAPLDPLERSKMTSDANEERTVDFHVVWNVDMTSTHDPRTSVADVELSTVQTNIAVILIPISDDMRQDQTNDKLT